MSRTPVPVQLSPAVDSALAACGRDRVFHNDGVPPSVAIRWRYADGPGDQDKVDQWIIGKAEGSAEGHDSAGRKAAQAFAAKLRERSRQLGEWAANIERHLTVTP